jgi:hypothetical protein
MYQHTHSYRIYLILAAAALCAGLGGCESAMYGGTPDDMSAAIAQPPYQVGGISNEEPEEVQSAPERHASDEGRQYEYRGGRDPVTGRAKTQM